MKSLKKQQIVFLFTLIFSFSRLPPLFSQEQLTSYNTSWTAVLPGSPTCAPVETSYGFCLATDARNIMGFSSTGQLLWEKKTARIRNPVIYYITDDFLLFYEKDKNIIRLLNPSGREIWSKSIDFKISCPPFAGRDGRFFIYGEKTLLCLSLNGTERWKMETEYQKDLPMQELPDGSLIVFLKDISGQTRGLRLSPFGKMLENITFAGSITSTNTCKDGILLTFSDGSAGLFSLKEGLAESRWVASVKNGNALFSVSDDFNKYYLLSLQPSQTTVYKLNSADGKVEFSKSLNIDGTKLLYTAFSSGGFFIADNKKAILLDQDFREIWTAGMPDGIKNKTVNHLIYLNTDYLIFLSKNWSMSAYHTSQTTNMSVNEKSVLNNIQSDYSSFAPLELSEINYFNQGSFYAQLKDPLRSQKLKEGDFGADEEKWLTEILSLAKLYSKNQGSSDFGIHTEKSVFETDSAGFEAILVQLALLSTRQTQNALAAILYSSKNKNYCRSLLSNLSGYDPDGKILEAIEVNVKRAGNKDSSYLNSICDAVYSICVFMGRPAWNKKGKDILKSLMGAEYNFNTRNYARDTLKKIIALEL